MIKIGTSGYRHDEWKRLFYPSAVKDNEMLDFYAQHFSAVELNTSFYNMPSKWMFINMAEKVPESFEFIVTAPRAITYDRERQRLAEFKEAIQPLAHDEKLAAVLLRFPYSCEPSEDSKSFILDVQSVLKAQLVVEFKNPAWQEESQLKFLDDNRLGFCILDEPRSKNAKFEIKVTGSIGYLKFNGRNNAAWFANRPRNEKYDYLYKEEELQEWLPKIKVLEKVSDKLFIIFNNFPKAQAVKNAALMSKLLGKEISLPKQEEHDSDLGNFI